MLPIFFLLTLWTQLITSKLITSKATLTSGHKSVICDSPFLREVIPAYLRLRDYYRLPGSDLNNEGFSWRILYFPKIVVIHTIALGVNATLISEESKWDSGRYPEIQLYYPSFKDFDEQDDNVSWSAPLGILVPVSSMTLAFTYCRTPMKERISVWKFSLFTAPFDCWTWLLLITTFLCVLPLSGKFMKVVMPLISATLSLGTQGPPKRSIFLLWLLSSIILGNFYCGELTGRIMVPPKDILLTEFHQLEQHKYVGILPNNSTLWIQGLEAENPTIKTKSRTGKIIQKILERAVLMEGERIPAALAFDKRRFVVIGPWPVVHLLIWTYQYFKKMSWFGTHSGPDSTRVCHIGKELAQVSEQYFSFLPPNNLELVRVFTKLIESGIYQRWDQEEHALMYSNRVQGRVRVKSPTKILEEVKPIKRLKLERKVVTMFLLLGICLIISFGGFCFELLFKKSSVWINFNYSRF